MKETIIVTGASGFIGQHLIPPLVAAGHQVVAGSRGAVNLPGTIPQVLPVRSGILSFDGLLAGVDTVIHLAGMAHFGRSLIFPGWSGRREFQQKLWQANVASTENLAREAIRAGVRRLVYLSSIGAVASSRDEVIRQDTPPEPDSDYGKSKLAAEVSLHQLLDPTPIELAIVRPPLVYGPLNVANMSRLIRWVRSGLPIPLQGVRNRRSLIYVENLVSLIQKIIETKDAPSLPVLASDGRDLSTPDLIREIARAGGWKARLFPFPLFWLRLIDRVLQTDVYAKLCGDLFVDISETQRLYSWTPPFSMEEGLTKTLAEYR